MRCYYCRKQIDHAHAFLVEGKGGQSYIFVCENCLSRPIDEGGKYVIRLGVMGTG